MVWIQRAIMATCFISYSRSDAGFTRQLAADLNKLRINYWLDVDRIQAGEDWDDAVWSGLQNCDLMLLVLSPASMSSKEVSNEWKYYLSQDKPIIPILVEPTDSVPLSAGCASVCRFSRTCV